MKRICLQNRNRFIDVEKEFKVIGGKVGVRDSCLGLTHTHWYI